jgi:TRAP-type C4-dicarboxylate transport system permease small subunit
MKRIEKFLSIVAAAALFAMMLLTFIDVIGRKFFDESLTGSLELTELLMLVLIFFALPLTSLYGEHVIFDLLDRAVSQTGRRLQHLLSNGICALMLLGASWLIVERAQRTAEFGDVTSQLAIEIAPFHFLVAVALALTALIHLILMARGRPGQSAAH